MMNGEAGDSKAGWAGRLGRLHRRRQGRRGGLRGLGARSYSGTTYIVKGKTSSGAVALGALGSDGFRIDGDARRSVRLLAGLRRRRRRPQARARHRRAVPRPRRLAHGRLGLRPQGRRDERRHVARHPARRRLPHRRCQDPGRRGLVRGDLARPQQRRHRRRPARRAGRGPPVGPDARRPPRTAWARRSRSAPRYVVYGSKTPANVNVGSHGRQGPAAHGRRRLPLGRPGRLERRRSRRPGQQRRQRRRRRHPGLGLQPADARSAPAATAASRCCSTA